MCRVLTQVHVMKYTLNQPICSHIITSFEDTQGAKRAYVPLVYMSSAQPQVTQEMKNRPICQAPNLKLKNQLMCL